MKKKWISYLHKIVLGHRHLMTYDQLKNDLTFYYDFQNIMNPSFYILKLYIDTIIIIFKYYFYMGKYKMIITNLSIILYNIQF